MPTVDWEITFTVVVAAIFIVCGVTMVAILVKWLRSSRRVAKVIKKIQSKLKRVA